MATAAPNGDLHDYRSATLHPIATRTSGHKDYKKPHADPEEYKRMYKESIEDPTKFWDEVSCFPCFQLPFPSFFHFSTSGAHGRNRPQRILTTSM